MIRSLVLLCTVGVVLGFGGGEEKMIKKYTHIRTIMGCVGEEPVLSFFKQLRNACEACNAQDMGISNTIDLTTFIKSIQDKNQGRNPWLVPVYYIPQQNNQYNPYGRVYQQPQYQQPQYQQPQYQPQYQPSQQNPQYPYSNQYVPQYGYASGHSVTKRAVGLKRSLKVMTDNIQAKISNITCVLRAMKFLDENDQVNYDQAVKWVQELPISDELKSEFYEGHEFCREFSSCLPTHKLKNPIAKKFGSCLAYMKCYKMKEMKACMKQDYMRYAPLIMGGDNTMYGQSSHDFLMNDMDSSPDMMMQNMYALMIGDSLDF